MMGLIQITDVLCNTSVKNDYLQKQNNSYKNFLYYNTHYLLNHPLVFCIKIEARLCMQYGRRYTDH